MKTYPCALFGLALLSLASLTQANTTGIRITTCEELQNMGHQLDAIYYLDNDLDCSAKDFLPIEGRFSGVLDGQNHTIENLKIVGKPGGNAALFSHGFSTGIRDIRFTNARVIADDDTQRALLIAHAEGYPGLINIHVDNLTIPGRPTESSRSANSTTGVTGGLVAQADMVSFTNVHVKNVKLRLHTIGGGMLGAAKHVSLGDSSVHNLSTTLDDNRDYQSDNDQSKTAFGGLIGVIPANGYAHLVQSSTTGIITAPIYAGGIIGRVGSSAKVIIIDSYSQTHINAFKRAGGIIGYAWPSSSNIMNVQFDHVYATGHIHAQEDARAMVGGNDRHARHVVAYDSYFDKESTDRKYSGDNGSQPRSTNEMIYMHDKTFSEKNGWARSVWVFIDGQYPKLVSDL